MAKFFKREGAEEYVAYYHKHKAIKMAHKTRQKIKSRIKLFLIPLLFISPPLFFFVIFTILGVYIKEFHGEFLSDPRKTERYRGLFSAKTSSEALALVGYQVFEDELESHIQIVKANDPVSTKKLKDKQTRMMSWKNRWRWVGLDRKLLTTHLLVPGKTGAGKTELVRSIANEACFKTGGGLLFNDGKSDTGLLREFVNQASKEGRETSVSVMNFLKPEKNAETNTFSPLSIMHPVKTVEFLGGLVGGGDSGGNSDYFFQQGKAMLSPVVSSTYIRNKYFSEGYNLEKIFENTKVSSITLLRIITYCMCRDINDKIATNPVLKAAISTIPSAPSDENLAAIEALIEYITQNATTVSLPKDQIDIDFVQIKELYVNCYSLLDGYLSKIWNQYSPFLDVTSRVLYRMIKNTNHNFYGENAVDIREIKHHYGLLRSLVNPDGDEDGLDKLNQTYKLLESEDIVEEDLHEVTKALHRKMQQGGNIDAPPADAIQQLSYAQQQFNTLANVFAMYKHVFGQTKPEIRPDKLIKDNRFLYIVLPPLELNPKITEILGKMIVATIKEVAAIALLGEKLSIHSTLANVFKDRLTPKPFTFIVLDEYGAYPVEGIDLLLAQIRSLNMSACIAVQDNASLKVGGDSTTSQERALANTTKIISKTEDKDMVEWVRSMLSDSHVETPKLQKDLHGNWASTTDVEIKEQKSFDVEKLRDFGNGFALLLLGSKEEDLIFLQSFYRGGTASTIFIKRYLNLNFV